MSLSVYRALLRLYPASYRVEYEADHEGVKSAR